MSEEVPLTVERDGEDVVVGTATMMGDGTVQVNVTDKRMKKLLGEELDRLSVSVQKFDREPTANLHCSDPNCEACTHPSSRWDAP